VTLDQTVAGSGWISLGKYYNVGSTLTVEVVKIGAGTLRADAAKVTGTTAPTTITTAIDDGNLFYAEIAGTWATPSSYTGIDGDARASSSAGATVRYSFTNLSQGWHELRFNIPDHPTATERATIVVESQGQVLQRIEFNEKVPVSGWSSLGAFCVPGSSIDVTITQSGANWLMMDAFELSATTAPTATSFVVDDGESNHAITGTWAAGPTSGAAGGDSDLRAGAASVGATSTWSFTGVPAGEYEVWVTWRDGSNRATNAPYTINTGSASTTVTVNQKLAPSGATFDGVNWKSLGTFDFTKSWGNVVLTNAANGYVSADAVRLVLVTAADPIAPPALPALPPTSTTTEPPAAPGSLHVVNATPGDVVVESVDRVVLDFNRPVDPDTFTTDDVTITGPNDESISPTDVVQISLTQFAVLFAKQTELGVYRLTLGSEIEDLDGDELDQDRDGVEGEAESDDFTVSFRVVAGARQAANETNVNYDAGGRIHSVIDALGGVYQYAYDSAGNLTSTTDELGRVTTYTYDDLGRLTSVALPDAGAGAPTTTYEYDSVGNLTKLTDAEGRETTYVYDAFDRLVELILPDPDGTSGPQTASSWVYVYDGLGRTTKVVGPDPDGPGGVAAPETDYAYDAAGKVLSVTDPLDRVTSYQYDAHDNVVKITLPDPDGAGTGLPAPEWEWTYNDVGQVLTETDPLDRTTTYSYDEIGRLVSETLPDPDGSGGPQTAPVWTYSYDAVGNLVGVTDALGRTTQYLYDELYRQTAAIDALGGVSAVEYDAASQATALIDRLGRRTAFGYDALGRNTTVTLPDPDGAGSQASPVWSYEYDRVGNLLSETDPLLHVTTYAYDDLDRLVLVTQPDPDGALNPGVAPTWEYAYDKASQLTSVADPLDRVTSYGYDGLGRNTSVALPDPDGTGGAQAAPVWNYAYDLAGQLTSVTAPDPDGAGARTAATTTYAYDFLGRTTSITEADPDGAGGLAAPVTSYTYDVAGQLTSVVDPVGRSFTYEYDKLG
ncbi:MAG TPA: hypothetical protein VGF99_08300, partial [Myxococcota bacterium]